MPPWPCSLGVGNSCDAGRAGWPNSRGHRSRRRFQVRQASGRQAAEQLADAYRTVGLTREEFLETGRYTRLAALKRLLDADQPDDGLRWRNRSAD